MDSINFKAHYVDKFSVKKWSSATNKYRNKNVCLVKLNYDSMADYQALKTLSGLWAKEENFIDTILAKLDYNRRNQYTPKSDIYFLTTQKKIFKYLKPEKILGIAEVTTKDDTSSYDYVQTRPDSMYGNDKRLFQEVGDIITKYVTKKFGRNHLYGYTIEKNIPFFERNGFVVVQKNLINPLIKYVPDSLRK